MISTCLSRDGTLLDFQPSASNKRNMKNLWNDQEARDYQGDPLHLRVYTSQLLGREADLVLHGGGNTSVKIRETNIFGEEEEILYVKGSGWNLETIEAPGFAPVRMETLLKLAELESLTDSEMVRLQRSAMTNPNAPNPSVEAILHAVIPFKYVDHTHADAVVTITNTPNGEERIRELYGDSVIIVPYVMPGFILAKAIYEQTKGIDWSKYKGMILLNHGVFTYDEDPKASYDKMIELVSMAEDYIREQDAEDTVTGDAGETDLLALAGLRKEVAEVRGRAMIAKLDSGDRSTGFSELPNVADITNRGPITPDHIIRTKRTAMMVEEGCVAKFTEAYKTYFEAQTSSNSDLTMLDPAPRWAVWPGRGTIAFGDSLKAARIIHDIKAHTIKAIQQSEKMGGWTALPQQDLFEMEYWELEQAKLKKGGKAPEFQGKIALVTGHRSGIGRGCAEALKAKGATVLGVDINVDHTDPSSWVDKEIELDLTVPEQILLAVETVVREYGGLDILISNAGSFPASEKLKDMQYKTWWDSLDLNLTAHQQLLSAAIPYLELGLDPAVIFIGSKNVPAPGPGVAAYSVPKAGLTQLCRVAALELAPKGIRVNIVHPDAVYDTGIWTEEVLNARSAHYGMSVEEYKRRNLLKTEVTSADVGRLVAEMAGGLFSKITGAQLPVDGGNIRVV